MQKVLKMLTNVWETSLLWETLCKLHNIANVILLPCFIRACRVGWDTSITPFVNECWQALQPPKTHYNRWDLHAQFVSTSCPSFKLKARDTIIFRLAGVPLPCNRFNNVFLNRRNPIEPIPQAILILKRLFFLDSVRSISLSYQISFCIKPAFS